MQHLPENHFRVSEASWVNVNHYYFLTTWVCHFWTQILICDLGNQELRSMSSFDVEVEDQNDITGEHKHSIIDFNQKRGGVGKCWYLNLLPVNNV